MCQSPFAQIGVSNVLRLRRRGLWEAGSAVVRGWDGKLGWGLCRCRPKRVSWSSRSTTGGHKIPAVCQPGKGLSREVKSTSTDIFNFPACRTVRKKLTLISPTQSAKTKKSSTDTFCAHHSRLLTFHWCSDTPGTCSSMQDIQAPPSEMSRRLLHWSHPSY